MSGQQEPDTRAYTFLSINLAADDRWIIRRTGAKGSQEQSKLVPWLIKMHEHHFLDEPVPELGVCPVVGHAKDDTKLVTQVLHALIPGAQSVRLEASEEQLDTVRHERVLVVLHDETLEYLLVGRPDEGLEEQHHGNHVLLLAPGEAEGRAAVGEVMQRVGDAGLVGAHAADLDGVRRVGRPAVGEGGAEEGDDVVAAGEDQKSDQALVPVHDKVPAELGGLLVLRDEARGGHAAEVAAV